MNIDMDGLKVLQHKLKTAILYHLVKGEENTKLKLIIPFLRLIGYDEWDIEAEEQVNKRSNGNDRVDYVIRIDGEVIAIVECKTLDLDLNKYVSQLKGYYQDFCVKGAHIAILTDGNDYWFFTDGKKPNVMDKEPFYKFNLENAEDVDFKGLEAYTKENITSTFIPHYEAIQKKRNNSVAKISDKAITNSILGDRDTSRDGKNISKNPWDADNSEVIVPKEKVEDMLNLLPPSIWNEQSKFLVLACKGEFLWAICNRLKECDDLKKKYPDETERTARIITNQLYGVYLSDRAYNNIFDKPYFNRSYERLFNLVGIRGYNNKFKNNNFGQNPDGTIETFRDLLDKEFGKDMDFDVVIGNPPYQDSNGGGSNEKGGTTLYDKFIHTGLTVSNRVCMITKNSWLNQSTLKSIRDEMIKNGIVKIVNYPIIKEVFTDANVAVSIWLIDKPIAKDGKIGKVNTEYTQIEHGGITHKYKAELYGLTTIPESEAEMKIIQKVKSDKTFEQYVFSNTPFGIRTNGISKGRFIDEKDTKSEEHNIAVMHMAGTTPYFKYTKMSEISKNQGIVNEYKIVCGQQFNKNESVLTNIKGLAPMQVCTSSYGCVFHSSDRQIANNAYKYICTRLFRFLVYASIEVVSTIASSRFHYVPDQDFTSNSDIDWSQSIADIDKQLYQKYNLTQEEIDYIEKTIKPMD